MARAESPSERMLKVLIARAITPPLKASGFRKTGMSYHRRKGETAQVVNVQVSHGSTATAKTFYLNIGIAFDAVCGLKGLAVNERPKEYECDARGMRVRLEELLQEAPPEWRVGVGEGMEETVRSLGSLMAQLMIELDRVSSISAYRAHPWFDRDLGVGGELNPQVLYLLGEYEAARHEVEQIVIAHADHPFANGFDWWANKLGLRGLRSR